MSGVDNFAECFLVSEVEKKRIILADLRLFGALIAKQLLEYFGRVVVVVLADRGD